MCLEGCMKITSLDKLLLLLSPLPLLQWLTLLKESISPTQPVELRIAVARSLLKLWNVVHETVDITVYCKLVVDLLQDADVDVREEMAESVAAIIAQANIPCKWWYTTLGDDGASHCLDSVMCGSTG